MQTRLNAINKANDEREEAIATVDAELRELLKRAIAEDSEAQPAQPPAAATAPAQDPTAAWETVTNALSAMAAQPGVPSGWAVQMGNLLDHIRMAASSIQQHVGAVNAPGAAQDAGKGGPAPLAAATQAASASASAASSSPAAPAPSAVAAAPPQPAATAPVQRESWESRVLELAFTDSTNAGAAAAVTTAPTVPAVAAVPPVGPGTSLNPNDIDSDLESYPSDEDDMDSIAGDEFNLREGETELQRKRRIKKHLRERENKRREAKKKDGTDDKKQKEAKTGGSAAKDAPRSKLGRKK